MRRIVILIRVITEAEGRLTVGMMEEEGENSPVRNIFALLTPYERERLVAHTMYVGLKRGLTPEQMDQYAFNAALGMLKGPRIHAPHGRSVFHWIISVFSSPRDGVPPRR